MQARLARICVLHAGIIRPARLARQAGLQSSSELAHGKTALLMLKSASASSASGEKLQLAALSVLCRLRRSGHAQKMQCMQGHMQGLLCTAPAIEADEALRVVDLGSQQLLQALLGQEQVVVHDQHPWVARQQAPLEAGGQAPGCLQTCSTAPGSGYYTAAKHRAAEGPFAGPAGKAMRSQPHGQHL